jgi:CheY-like chemotaxis protein
MSGRAHEGIEGTPRQPRAADAAEALLCQTRRMEIVGQLTGGVVHDFNNILTVITGTIEILAEAVADRPDLAAVAELIGEAAARGAHLTAHLLAFARGQPSQPREVDVNALIVETARLLRPTLGEQIEIDTVLATDVTSAVVDASQLMAAILDVAIIARDAMPNGGKLAFETRGSVAQRSHAGDGSILAAADDVVIAVHASGHGIAAPDLDRAFGDLGATGDFIERSNGHVEVRSGTGRGTSVEIRLPSAVGVARSQAEDSTETPIEGGREAILIVEDDVMVRRYVVAQIQSLGYWTLEAGNAGEALAHIDQREEIDLLFTDVMMPGSINGWQLAIEALNRRSSLKVLFTSGYAKKALVQDRRLDAGALLLAKPYRKIDLAKMIRRALAA